MKLMTTILVLATSALSSSAFALNPCTSSVLKVIKCEIVDQANQTHAQVLLTRAITTGGGRSYCTKDVIEESLAVYAYFKADGPAEKVDLLFTATKLMNPMKVLESGGTVEANLYSAGRNLDDVQSAVAMSSQNGVVGANFALQARNLLIYSQNQSPVTISGSAICTEAH